jgi:hypothetical protein
LVLSEVQATNPMYNSPVLGKSSMAMIVTALRSSIR